MRFKACELGCFVLAGCVQGLGIKHIHSETATRIVLIKR